MMPKHSYPRFMRPDIVNGEREGIDILWFRTWHFTFKWFTDYGEWFVYLSWITKKTVNYLRFSSAGFMKGENERIDENAY